MCFEALLHHCFVCLLKHVAAILQREKVYSIKFANTNVRPWLSICLWEGKEMVTLTIAPCGRNLLAVRSCVLLSSQVLSAVSLEPTIICCAGGSVDFIKALYEAASQKAGMYYPFELLPLQIEKFRTNRALV